MVRKKTKESTTNMNHRKEVTYHLFRGTGGTRTTLAQQMRWKEEAKKKGKGY